MVFLISQLVKPQKIGEPTGNAQYGNLSYSYGKVSRSDMIYLIWWIFHRSIAMLRLLEGIPAYPSMNYPKMIS
jgi:hypothetical protein